MPYSSFSIPASFAIGVLKSTLRTLRRSRCRRRRVFAQRLLLVRPGVHGRGALRLDHRERGAGLEDLLEQQRGAHREGGADRHRDAGRPEEGIRGVDAVVGLEAQDLGEAPALEDRGALGVQHPLRLRGGARGVDQDAVVAGSTSEMAASSSASLTPCSCASSCPQVSTPPRGASISMQATRRSWGRSRQRSRPGRAERDRGVLGEQILEEAVLLERRLHQQHRRVAVPEHVLELGPAREGVHGDQHAAQHAHREGGHDPLRAVAHVHRDAGALHDARPDQRARQQARLALELAVGERASLEDDRAPRTKAGRDLRKEAAERQARIVRLHRRSYGFGSITSALPVAITASAWFVITTLRVAIGLPDGSSCFTDTTSAFRKVASPVSAGERYCMLL